MSAAGVSLRSLMALQEGGIFDVSDVGAREVVDGAKATELFAPLNRTTLPEPITTIRLTNKSYTLDAGA